MKKHATLTLIMLSLIGVLNYLDRFLISVVGNEVKLEFGLTDTRLGLLMGPAFVLVYACSTLLAGWAADRINRRNLVAVAVFFWSAMTAASGAATNFVQLALLRAGVGIGEGGVLPAAFSMISDHYPPARRAGAFAIVNTVGQVGMLLSFVMGGYVAAQYGWRTAFLVAGLPGILLAVVFLFTVGEPQRGHADAADPNRPVLATSQSIALLLGNRTFLWLAMGIALGAFATAGMLQWLPIFFIRSHALSLQQIGLLFGPPLAIGTMAGMTIGGPIGLRLAKKSAAAPIMFCAYASAAVVPLYWIVLWLPDVRAALVMTLLAATVATLSNPSYTAAVQNVVDLRVRGMATAGYLLGSALLAQSSLPLLAGVISDALLPMAGKDSVRYALSIMIGIGLVAAGCFAMAARCATRQEKLKHGTAALPVFRAPGREGDAESAA